MNNAGTFDFFNYFIRRGTKDFEAEYNKQHLGGIENKVQGYKREEYEYKSGNRGNDIQMHEMINLWTVTSMKHKTIQGASINPNVVQL